MRSVAPHTVCMRKNGEMQHMRGHTSDHELPKEESLLRELWVGTQGLAKSGVQNLQELPCHLPGEMSGFGREDGSDPQPTHDGNTITPSGRGIPGGPGKDSIPIQIFSLDCIPPAIKVKVC